jgi:5-methylcytosine-specific restriction endonuclease McrA
MNGVRVAIMAKTKLDEQAYKRDRYQCTECGKKRGIEAHHIIPLVETLDNLITLCHACHKRKHDMAGCFKKGEDAKRELHKENLLLRNTKGSGLGKPFMGNQFIDRYGNRL